MNQKIPSPAVKAANKFFKQPSETPATDYEKAQSAFHENRERLKAERLAREAEHPDQPHSAR